VAGYCEHSNESSGSTEGGKYREYLSKQQVCMRLVSYDV
jgi:hypothetical protein